MKIEINGRKLEVNVVKSNLREKTAKSFGVALREIPEGFFKYDAETNTMVVDKDIDISYAKYAAIHECICSGPYKSMSPKTTNQSKRCALIDRMLIKLMPKAERKDYINKRIRLFEMMIEYGLEPAKQKSFQEAVKMLSQASS